MSAAVAMVPCARRCGPFVGPEAEPACGPCQAADTSHRAEDERERARRAKLVVTKRRAGRHVVRTSGYAVSVRSVHDDSEFPTPSELLFSGEARKLAATICDAAAFVEGLTSPFRPVEAEQSDRKPCDSCGRELRFYSLGMEPRPAPARTTRCSRCEAVARGKEHAP